MADNKREGEQGNNFDIISEAQRIARGEPKPVADAREAASQAEVTEIFDRLGGYVEGLRGLVEGRNVDESNTAGIGIARIVEEAGRELDRELDEAQRGENPEEDKRIAIKRYFGHNLNLARREIRSFMRRYDPEVWPVNEEEEQARGLVGPDLVPTLALAKMVFALNERDEFGVPVRNPDGSISLPVLPYPRIRPEEERWEIAAEAVKGELLLGAALLGDRPDNRIQKDVDYIIGRARREFQEGGQGPSTSK